MHWDAPPTNSDYQDIYIFRKRFQLSISIFFSTPISMLPQAGPPNLSQQTGSDLRKVPCSVSNRDNSPPRFPADSTAAATWNRCFAGLASDWTPGTRDSTWKVRQFASLHADFFCFDSYIEDILEMKVETWDFLGSIAHGCSSLPVEIQQLGWMDETKTLCKILSQVPAWLPNASKQPHLEMGFHCKFNDVFPRWQGDFQTINTNKTFSKRN